MWHKNRDSKNTHTHFLPWYSIFSFEQSSSQNNQIGKLFPEPAGEDGTVRKVQGGNEDPKHMRFTWFVLYFVFKCCFSISGEILLVFVDVFAAGCCKGDGDGDGGGGGSGSGATAIWYLTLNWF